MTHLMNNLFERLEIQATYQNIIKAVYSKSIAKFKFNGEKLKGIPVELGTRQGCSLSSDIFNLFNLILAALV